MELDALKLMTDRDKSSDMVGLSIAISLKRIADALEYVPAGGPNIYDFVREIAESSRSR
jgi:hypothetical protein